MSEAYIKAYEKKEEALCNTFVKPMAKIPQDIDYDFVDAFYDYLDGLGDSDIQTWSDEETLSGFIAFIEKYHENYIDKEID